MNIVYLGAEVPSNRIILENMGVKHMGVSVWGLIRRGLPKTKTYLLENYFPDDVSIYVHPGVPSGKEFTAAELEEFCAEYEEFIADNLERITLFSEVQHPGLTQEFVSQQRAAAWDEVPEEKFAAIYTEGDLETLAIRYLNVVIPGNIIDERPDIASQARRLAQKHGTTFHAAGVASPDILRNSPFTTASSLAWLSPMLRGETIVWYANKLTRYPKRMKEQARSRYKSVYEQANLDFDKILADDGVEVSKLAVWSYLQFEDWSNKLASDIVTTSDENDGGTIAETPTSDVTTRGSDMRKLSAREPGEIAPLPVLGIELSRVIETNDQGIDVLKDVPVVRSNSTSLRQCNTCFVAANCPAFKQDSACAFNLPIEVKTREQYQALINAFLEMQGQRVAFAKFTEDLNGGYPDPNVGQEMDRFFKMLKTIRELDESKEMMRVTVERSGGAGVLSSLFGDRAQILNELPNGGMSEEQTNQVIKRLDGDGS